MLHDISEVLMLSLPFQLELSRVLIALHVGCGMRDRHKGVDVPPIASAMGIAPCWDVVLSGRCHELPHTHKQTRKGGRRAWQPVCGPGNSPSQAEAAACWDRSTSRAASRRAQPWIAPVLPAIVAVTAQTLHTLYQ
jgi:hypothetical protein